VLKSLGGRFRWVACQLDHLCDLPTDGARRKALKELPPTLYETYDRILRKLLPLPLEVRKIAQKTLHWIGLEKYLTVSQLCEAVSIPDTVDEMDSDDVVDEAEISRRCSSLIRKSFGGNSFEFAHFTVLEYLQNISSSSPLEFFRFSKTQATSSLLSTSFRFLTFPTFERRPLAVLAELKSMAERNERHAFYSCAARLFLRSSTNHREHKALETLLQDPEFFQYAKKLFNPEKSGIFLSWVLEGASRPHSIRFDQDQENKQTLELAMCILKPEFTPLHIAASLSQPAICRFLLDQGVDANSASDVGTPLHCAVSGPLILGAVSADASVSGLEWTGRRYRLGDWPDNVDVTLSLLLDHGADASRVWRSNSALAMAVRASLGRQDIRGLLALFRPATVIPDDVLQEFEGLDSGVPGRDKYLSSLLDGLLDKVAQFGPSTNLSRLLPCMQRIVKRRDLTLTTLPPAMQYVAGMSDKDILDAIRVTTQFDLDKDLKALLAHTAMAERKLGLHVGKVPVLHLAARNNSWRAAAILLDSGVAVDVLDNEGKTALHLCCERNHAETAKVLLDQGARIDIKSTAQGHTAWHLAARHESSNVLLLLFEFDKDSCRSLSALSGKGQTPLSCAVLSGAASTPLLILDRLERPYEQSIFQSNLPLLHSAASLGNQELFSRLIDSGVSLPQTSADGSTPLHYLRPFCTADFFKYLLSLYDPFQPRYDGKTPLELFLLHLDSQGDEDKQLENTELVDANLVRSLLPLNHTLPRAGADGIQIWEFFCVEVISRFGNFCLNRGSCGGGAASEASSYLSRSSGDDDDYDDDGHDREKERKQNLKCKRGILCSVLDALLDCGVLASFETATKKPASVPLFAALLVRKTNEDTRGTNIQCTWIVPAVSKVVSTSTFSEGTPTDSVSRELLVRAIRASEVELVSLLLKYDPDVHSPVGPESPIEAACRYSGLPTFQAVLKHVDETRVNEVRPLGHPLLHHVIDGGALSKTEKVKALIAHGAEVNLAPAAHGKISLISRAAERGHLGVVDLLLESGADPYSEDANGNTLAVSAVLTANFRLLKLLCQGEAPPVFWAKTYGLWFDDKKKVRWSPGGGCTLLHCSALCANADVMQYLMDEGLIGNLNAVSANLLTALHFAALRGNIDGVKLLLEKGADLNMRDTRGWLPLDSAFAVGDFEVARVLVEAGSKKTLIPQWIELLTSGSKDASGLDWGQRAFSPTFRLESAIVTGDLDECRAIVEKGCPIDINLPSCHGCPPLFCAVRANRPDIVSWLVSAGASPDYVGCQRHHLVFWGLAQLATHSLSSVACLDQLLTYILDCGFDAFGWHHTPLHVAVLDENIPALKTIISHIHKHEKAYRYVITLQVNQKPSLHKQETNYLGFLA